MNFVVSLKCTGLSNARARRIVKLMAAIRMSLQPDMDDYQKLRTNGVNTPERDICKSAPAAWQSARGWTSGKSSRDRSPSASPQKYPSCLLSIFLSLSFFSTNYLSPNPFWKDYTFPFLRSFIVNFSCPSYPVFGSRIYSQRTNTSTRTTATIIINPIAREL